MPVSDFDFISDFSALDELIQLIYQGSYKFVLISSVDSVSWTIHLGLTGSEGRWWKGKWTEKDIDKFIGHKSSSKLVETFADRLAETIVQGELYIGDWSPDKGAHINLTLGPSANTPVHVQIAEMEPQDAAAYASKVFTEIALQAQSRKCRLHAPAYSLASVQSVPQASAPPPAVKYISEGKPSSSRPKLGHSHPDSSGQNAAKIKQLEVQLAKAQEEIKETKRHPPPVERKPSENLLASRAKGSGPSGKPVKGASLANPNKKARKYQELEFEDDD